MRLRQTLLYINHRESTGGRSVWKCALHVDRFTLGCARILSLLSYVSYLFREEEISQNQHWSFLCENLLSCCTMFLAHEIQQFNWIMYIRLTLSVVKALIMLFKCCFATHWLHVLFIGYLVITNFMYILSLANLKFSLFLGMLTIDYHVIY